MTPGTIVHYPNFEFHDGSQANKLLIVLNSGGKKPYLVLKTTSRQGKWRAANEGCHADKGYFFLPARRDNFPENTWILLDDFYEVDAKQFLAAHFSGGAGLKGSLKGETLRAIINCARKSEDWSEHYDDLLS